jgi:hypothetical protein
MTRKNAKVVFKTGDREGIGVCDFVNILEWLARHEFHEWPPIELSKNDYEIALKAFNGWCAVTIAPAEVQNSKLAELIPETVAQRTPH